MKNYQYNIGVDVSKKTLDICVLRGTTMVFATKINNSQTALTKLGSKLKKQGIKFYASPINKDYKFRNHTFNRSHEGYL